MRAVLALVAAMMAPACVSAQATGDASPQGNEAVVTASSILTVDIDRLFGQSEFGQRIGRDYTEGRAELATENRRIAEALRQEELDLAERRPDMDPDVFRAEAEAFDEKAQGIRRAQDAKERALEELLSNGRDQFLDSAQPILGELMVERGGVIILDRRSILLSLGSVDITDAAIERVNAALGDGGTAGSDN